MNEEDFRKLLYRVLKQNKCYVSFKKNVKPSALNDLLKCYANHYSKYQFHDHEFLYIAKIIEFSFPWSATKEGYNFWHKIYKQMYCLDDMPSYLLAKSEEEKTIYSQLPPPKGRGLP